MTTGRIPSIEGGIQPTIFDAKADILTATAADTPARLAVGANGTVLTADSSEATGLKFAAPAGGGKVLQVVSTVKTSAFTTTSTSFTDITGFSVTITPTLNTSKVYVSIALSGGGQNGTSGIYYNLVRGSTNIAVGDSGGGSPETLCTSSVQSFDVNNVPSTAILFLDSPATTSATTYKIQCKVDGGTGVINRTSSGNYGRSVSTITVLEIGA